MKKPKDFTYKKLVIQLTFCCKKLQKYLTDDEIAKLIALGFKEDRNNEDI